jgi:hypothetical protein
MDTEPSFSLLHLFRCIFMPYHNILCSLLVIKLDRPAVTAPLGLSLSSILQAKFGERPFHEVGWIGRREIRANPGSSRLGMPACRSTLAAQGDAPAAILEGLWVSSGNG